MSLSSARVIDVQVDAIGLDALVDQVVSWTGPTRVAVGVNAHVCNAAARSPRFLELVESADIRYPDGQSVVWALRALGADCRERVATTDLAVPLARRCAAEGLGVFLLGGEPGIADRAAGKLASAAPGLRVRAEHGFHSAVETPALIERINEFGPHVLLVGFGDPLQQEWLAEHRHALSVPAALTCGGLFDWLSGRNRRPPDWMVSSGLEWAWRLWLEPRRLARRYLIGNPAFMLRFARQLARRHLTRR